MGGRVPRPPCGGAPAGGKCEVQKATAIQNMFGEVVNLVCVFLTVTVSSIMRAISVGIPSHYLSSPLTEGTKDVPLTNIRNNSKVMGARYQRKVSLIFLYCISWLIFFFFFFLLISPAFFI